MSGNNLSNCELFICKVATVKHHIISALFQPHQLMQRWQHQNKYLKRAGLREAEFISLGALRKALASAKTQVNQGWIMTLCASSLKLNGSATNIWLVRWFQALKEHCYIRTYQSINFRKRRGIIGQNRKNNANPVGWKFSGNTGLQLSHIHVLWKHSIQLGNLSKQHLLPLIKWNIFTTL